MDALKSKFVGKAPLQPHCEDCYQPLALYKTTKCRFCDGNMHADWTYCGWRDVPDRGPVREAMMLCPGCRSLEIVD